ncbi:MAG: hypothetical protein R3C28_10045 [Pirellulaceae bacterium]
MMFYLCCVLLVSKFDAEDIANEEIKIVQKSIITARIIHQKQGFGKRIDTGIVLAGARVPCFPLSGLFVEFVNCP